MKPKGKQYRIIYWDDHHSDSSWKTENEIKEWATKRKPCVTRGWVTFENRKCIVLSASFDGDNSYGENMCILKANIVK